jgi:hypothetical protein
MTKQIVQNTIYDPITDRSMPVYIVAIAGDGLSHSAFCQTYPTPANARKSRYLYGGGTSTELLVGCARMSDAIRLQRR